MVSFVICVCCYSHLKICMDHEDAVKVLKDVQGIVSVVNHTTVVTCVNSIVGTLKIIVKYSPRGTYTCAVV